MIKSEFSHNKWVSRWDKDRPSKWSNKSSFKLTKIVLAPKCIYLLCLFLNVRIWKKISRLLILWQFHPLTKCLNDISNQIWTYVETILDTKWFILIFANTLKGVADKANHTFHPDYHWHSKLSRSNLFSWKVTISEECSSFFWPTKPINMIYISK